MTFRNLIHYCRVGHLLAKPGQITNALKSPASIGQCKHCQLRYLQSCNDSKQSETKCGEHFKNTPCDTKPSKATKGDTKQAEPKPLPSKEQEIKLPRPDECCGNPCKDAFARFDLLYYRRSDKVNRDYQQTWAECPELLRKPKVVCCYENIKFPKLEKRPRMERPQTACQPAICTNTKTTCPRIHMPRCGKARRPPKCHVNREPKDCTKRKTPYPSFSECRRDIPKPRPPTECKCLTLPTMCEVWAHYHRQRAIKVGKN